MLALLLLVLSPSFPGESQRVAPDLPGHSRPVFILPAAGPVLVLGRIPVFPPANLGSMNPWGPRVRIGPNLVRNPGFESTSFPCDGFFLTLPAGSTVIDDWTIGSGNVDICGLTLWPAIEGCRNVDLCGTVAGAIRQVIPTQIGAEYVVRIAVTTNRRCPGTARSAQVVWGTASASFSLNTAQYNADDITWTSFQAVFVATQASTTLELRSLTPSSCGIVVDDVQVRRRGP